MGPMRSIIGPVCITCALLASLFHQYSCQIASLTLEPDGVYIVQAGSEVTLKCTSVRPEKNVTDPPTYLAIPFHGDHDRPLISAGGRVEMTEDMVKYSTKRILSDIDSSNEGWYSCQASKHSVGLVAETEPTYILIYDVNITQITVENITLLSCELEGVDAEGDTTIRWTRNGTNLTSIAEIDDDDTDYMMYNDTLELIDVNAVDYGNYQCIVTFQVGDEMYTGTGDFQLETIRDSEDDNEEISLAETPACSVMILSASLYMTMIVW
ncbi:uncharacterized protein LOC100367123 [Saccoglossus kowalevskii]|uniref:MAM domain-containing glycosylphosphatidylinositol anchor protein 1-like n=1 Tax=Saccoglossus kowalevskii TaxID=10224 RepID=A0ABM0MD57_SACKO|nr:PREDICTED: MAM domain-containing glycosylphosphatidylinositol anchor protein 1-like [Saccoglossus kowalevskii]